MDVSEALSFNARLRQERMRRNWRQQDLAGELGTTVTTIKRWERGSQQPSAYFRAKLCALFERSAEELGLASDETLGSEVARGQAFGKHRPRTIETPRSFKKENSPMSWMMGGSHPQDYELGLDVINTYNEKDIGYFKSVVEEPAGFGAVMQRFDAMAYRGKRILFSAFVKTEDVKGWAGLWMRVDGFASQKTLVFDNMQERPIVGTTDWQKYEVVLDVSAESFHIVFGLLLVGKGLVEFSNVCFNEVGTDIPVTKCNIVYSERPVIEINVKTG